jgi:hypothetical protein
MIVVGSAKAHCAHAKNQAGSYSHAAACRLSWHHCSGGHCGGGRHGRVGKTVSKYDRRKSYRRVEEGVTLPIELGERVDRERHLCNTAEIGITCISYGTCAGQGTVQEP